MADTKLTNLSAISAIADEDLFYVVDDPGGTPVSNKATASQVKTYINATGKAFAMSLLFG
jgi:archaellum component FlaG (FlaF/FlaG flagellin family)